MKTNKRIPRGPLMLLASGALLTAFCLLQPLTVKAQWTTPDAAHPNINNTNSGNVGIGTTAPTNLLHINSGATPSSQFRISANNAGSLSGLAYSADNAALAFDVDWNGTNWIARHSTLAALYKSQGKLQVLGWTGATVGSPIPQWTTYTSLDLTSGKFGIGTVNPGYKLDVQGGQINTSGGLCIAGDCKTAWSQVGGSSQWIPSVSGIHYDSGNVGIGTDSPNARLHVSAGNSSVALFGPNTSWGGSLAIGSGADLLSPISARAQVMTSNGNLHLDGGVGQNVYVAWLTPTNTIINGQGGNVGIGNSSPTEKLHVTGNGKFTGNVTVDGNINAKYQDVAEWVPSDEQHEAGTVVVLDPTKTNQVVASTIIYDTRVAGVISAQPGITLGEGGSGKVLVATTGRVRVKVDASRGAIQIGDLLVTSDVPGMAMRSEPVEFAGRKMHMPGTIIGKALEPLAKGTGQILVLLSLQ